MGAVGPRNAGVRRARLAPDRGSGEHQEHALQIFRHHRRQSQRRGPGLACGGLRVHTGAGNGHPVAEFAQGHRRAGDPPHPQPHQKILIQCRVGAVTRLRIGQNFSQYGGNPHFAVLRRHRGPGCFAGRLGQRRIGQGCGAGQLGQNIGGRSWSGTRPALQWQGKLFRIGGKDQILDIHHRIRHRHQLRAGRARLRLDFANGDRQRPPRQCRAKTDEIAALQITKHLGLTPVHAQQIGGAGHVDIEKCPAHQEVGGFRGHVLGKFRQPLGGDHTRQSTLAAAAHQVGHSTERHLARIFRHIAAHGGCEHLRLVYDHQHRIPEFVIGIEHGVQEHRIEPLQRQHTRHPVTPDPAGDTGKLAFAALAIDNQMAVFVRQGDEIALGIDNHLLHPLR